MVYNYIFSLPSILLAGSSSIGWRIFAYLASYELFWIVIISLGIIFVGEVILAIIKFKEDECDGERRKERHKRRKR